MSQTGFPNGGILPDDTENFTYSELIKTEEEIKSIASALSAQAYNSQAIDPANSTTTSTHMEGVVTAALLLVQYWVQQVTYQGDDGYGTAGNPVSPNFSEQTSNLFLQSLGSDPDSGKLYSNYENYSRNLAAVSNTFFNLGSGKDSFTWTSEGNLRISDKYTFTAVSDFGIAPPQNIVNSGKWQDLLKWIPIHLLGVSVGTLIFAPLSALHDTLIGQIFFNALGPDANGAEPFYYLDYSAQYGGRTYFELGSLEPMFFRKEWTPQEIYDANPALFWEAVKRGFIPFSALLLMPDFICSSIEVGSGPDAFGFLPNYAPVNSDIGEDMNDWTFGGGGNYPRPFTSFAQRIVEANLSLGPFAMLDYKNPTTNVSTRISGRICYLSIACNGAPNEIGFIRQNWYGADTNGVGYGDNLLKWQWWEQAIKTKHEVRYGHLPGYPTVTVEVATASYAVGDDNNYSPDLPLQEDYTLLLGTLLAVAALGAII